MRSDGVTMSVNRMPNFVDDDDLALRDQVAVDEHVHRLAGERVELDDRACASCRMLDRDPRPPELDGQLDRDVQDHVDVVRGGGRAGRREVGERRRRDLVAALVQLGRRLGFGLGERGLPFSGQGVGAALRRGVRFRRCFLPASPSPSSPTGDRSSTRSGR